MNGLVVSRVLEVLAIKPGDSVCEGHSHPLGQFSANSRVDPNKPPQMNVLKCAYMSGRVDWLLARASFLLTLHGYVRIPIGHVVSCEWGSRSNAWISCTIFCGGCMQTNSNHELRS